MDHEKRLKILEKEISEIKELVKELSTQPKWISVSQASKQFDISPSVIRNRIYSGILIHSKDWKKNGRNFLINSKSIQKIL
jgi:hypothetical protein